MKPHNYGRAIDLVRRTGKPHLSLWGPANNYVVLTVHMACAHMFNPRNIQKDYAELDARALNFCRNLREATNA